MQLVQLARQNPDTGYWGKARLLLRRYLSDEELETEAAKLEGMVQILVRANRNSNR